MKPIDPIISLCAVPLFWVVGLADAEALSLAVDARNQTGSEDGSALHPYATLQAAIDAATSGDTVQVAKGTYSENVVMTDKALQILGGCAGGSTADYARGSGGAPRPAIPRRIP